MLKVSVITPTTPDRTELNERIKDIFSNQFYFSDNVFSEQLIDYGPGTIGEKLNRLCAKAKGDIILRFDSDDIYAPDWISKSVAALIESKAAIVGLSNAYFHNVVTDRVYEYSNDPKNQLYLCGATLCYWRSVWEKKPFPEKTGLIKDSGEDTYFITNAGKLHCHGYKDGFLATLHGANTCSHISVPLMKKLPQYEAAKIINHFYASAG